MTLWKTAKAAKAAKAGRGRAGNRSPQRHGAARQHPVLVLPTTDRKSTRLNFSHANISYAVFCLKKKKHTTISKRYHNTINEATDQPLSAAATLRLRQIQITHTCTIYT